MNGGEALAGFMEEIEAAPPFDLSPIANGEVDYFDEPTQQKILRYTRGSVRFASQRIVIPDALILHNLGIAWMMTSAVLDPGQGIDCKKVCVWQSMHVELKSLLCRYCEEQARNALAIGADGSAQSWLKAKGNLELIHPVHLVGKGATDEALKHAEAVNEGLYSDALSAAVEAAMAQKQQMELCDLKGEDIGVKIAGPRARWLQQNGLESEDPLVGKYLAWGMKTPSEIPDEFLVVKDGVVSKKLFEKNRAIVARNSAELFATLNGNVKQDIEERKARLRRVTVECTSDTVCGETPPLKVLEGKLDEVLHGLKTSEPPIMVDRWWPLLSEALRLPRYEIDYFDWASCYSDEGPDEPGLQYNLADETVQEVHYYVRQTEWWTDMDRLEWKVETILRQCKNLAIEVNLSTLIEQWIDIEAKWKMCRVKDLLYHCYGDLDAFAESFYKGIAKISVLLPSIGVPPEGSSPADPEERRISMIYDAAVRRVGAVETKEDQKQPAVVCIDVLVKSLVDLQRSFARDASFYEGSKAPASERLPSELMLDDAVVLGPYAALLGAGDSVVNVLEERWSDLDFVAQRLFALIEHLIGGYAAESAGQKFRQGIAVLRKADNGGTIPKDECISWCMKIFRDDWYDLGYYVERAEQIGLDKYDVVDPVRGESSAARSRRINARKAWYLKNSPCPDKPLRDSAVKILLSTETHLLFDLGLESTAFRYSKGEDANYTYESDVKYGLYLNLSYEYRSDYDDEVTTTLREANRWVCRARGVFLEALCAYCEKRAGRCPEDGEARKKWYLALAMLKRGPMQPTFSPERADEFVAKAHAAAEAEWVETKMHEKERAGIDEETRGMYEQMVFHLLEDASRSLTMDINLGLARPGATRLTMAEDRKAALLEACPLQKSQLEKMLAQLETRGIMRYEFITPNHPIMASALRPFTEEFYDFWNKACIDGVPTKELLEGVNTRRADFICSWQCVLDVLSEEFDADAELSRLQDYFQELYRLQEARLFQGNRNVDLDDYKAAFRGFKDKLLDMVSVVRAKDRVPKNSEDPNEALVQRIADVVKDSQEYIEKKVENANRNVLSVKKGMSKIKAYAEVIICNQGEDIELTDHDGKPYKTRAEGEDLEMLKEAFALVSSSGLSRSAVAKRVFDSHSSKAGHAYSYRNFECFRTNVYRYCEGMSRNT